MSDKNVSPTAMLVVGAGASGLAFALVCAAAGVRVRIIERRDRRPLMGKATGVAQGVWRQLKPYGIADGMTRKAIPMRTFVFHDDGNLVARIAVPEVGGSPPAHLYPQACLEQSLERALSERGVVVEYGTALADIEQSDTHARVTLTKQEGEMTERCDVGWLIGADGAHSTVRKRIGAPFVGRDYPEQWSVAEVSTAHWPADVQAQLFLRGDGVGLFLSQPEVGVVQGIQNAPGVGKELCRRFGDCALRYERDFRVSLRRVPTPRIGRIWLIGDAAHVQSPVGGQGLNLAIWDGITLANALLRNDLTVDRRLVSRAARVLFFTDFDYRMLATRVHFLRALRNAYWRVAARRPRAAHWFFRLISGVW